MATYICLHPRRRHLDVPNGRQEHRVEAGLLLRRRHSQAAHDDPLQCWVQYSYGRVSRRML